MPQFHTIYADTCTREQLSAHFSAVAPVRHAIVVCDPKTHESKGFGFVQL